MNRRSVRFRSAGPISEEETLDFTLTPDQDAFRQRVRSLLSRQPDLQVVGEAADGQEAVSVTIQLRPAIVLMDVRMPCLSGLDAAREITTQLAETAVIVLTTYELHEYRLAAARSGVSAYVVKRSLHDALLPTIRDVARSLPGAPALA